MKNSTLSKTLTRCDVAATEQLIINLIESITKNGRAM